MKQEVTYNGLTFVPYIEREKIDKRIAELAKQIKTDADGKLPLFLCVLNGAFPFASDLSALSTWTLKYHSYALKVMREQRRRAW